MALSVLRSRRGRITIGASALVVAVGVGAYALFGPGSGTPAAASATAEVRRGEVALTAAASGTVEPAREWSLGFSTSTEVTKVNVSAGDKVEKGDVLAKVDDTDAQTALDDAETALAEAEDAVTTAEAASDEDCSDSTTDGGGSNAPDANPSGSTVTGGPTTSASSSVSTVACTSTGGDAILTAKQKANQAQQKVDDAQDTVDGTVIRAPADGTVLSVTGSVGTIPAAEFITLGKMSGIQIDTAFSEADTTKLALGDTAVVTVADSADELPATITEIDLVGTAEDALVTYGVGFALDDPPEDILVGQTATVTVTVESVTDTLYVPVTALHNADGTTATVTVREADGTGSTRTVHTGLRGDRYVAILDGVSEGETVVTG